MGGSLSGPFGSSPRAAGVFSRGQAVVLPNSRGSRHMEGSSLQLHGVWLGWPGSSPVPVDQRKAALRTKSTFPRSGLETLSSYMAF